MNKNDQLLQNYVDILNNKIKSTVSIEEIFCIYNNITTTSKHGLACKTIIQKMAIYHINQKLSIEKLFIQSDQFFLDKNKTSINFRVYRHKETKEKFIIKQTTPHTALNICNNEIFNAEKFYKQYINPNIITLIEHIYNDQNITQKYNPEINTKIIPLQDPNTFSIDDYKIIPITKENLHYNIFWQNRKINTNLITNNIFTNIVYLQKNINTSFIKYLPIGFLFRDENYQIKQALLQYPTKNNNYPLYRHFGKGTGKESSLWQSQKLENQNSIFVVESPLDALSHYLLQENKPLNMVYLSTGGEPTENQYKLIVKMAEQRILHIGFDNDKEGNKFTDKLLEHINNHSIIPQNIIRVQATNKDFNEDLLTQNGYILSTEKIATPIHQYETIQNTNIKTTIKPLCIAMKH